MLLDRIFQPRANIVEGDLNTVLRQLLAAGGGQSHAGISVTPESALRTAAVYACIKVLSEDVGKLPLILYRRTFTNGRDGRERATGHPLYGLMQRKPNSLQTPMGYRETVTGATALRGNGVSFINRVGRGRVKELVPIHPDSVEIKRTPTGERRYEVRLEGGKTRTLDQEEVLHVMGLSLNGWSGVSPITYARETIGLTQATERHGAKTFSNGARLGGILTYPGRFKNTDTGQRVAEDFDAKSSGEHAHRTVVLEEGMKWNPVTMTADDAQYLETRAFQVPEIARFWRMPLHKIQDLTRATFSNIEHQAIEYVVDTLGPWLTRWEQALNIALLTPPEQEEYYFEFLVDGLLRGDIKSRYEAYGRGILSGFLTRNEVRARENLPWIDGLDEPLTPTNMAMAGTEENAKGGTQ